MSAAHTPGLQIRPPTIILMPGGTVCVDASHVKPMPPLSLKESPT